VAAFHRDGYVLVEKLFDDEEMELLRQIARADHHLQREAASRADGEGGAIKLVVENSVTDDIYGAFVRCRRIVEPLEQVLEDEVYHYHHKMILKEAFVGGAWAWHQDYGYWYNNGCLFPDLMASCMIAVDRATRENGCLQVIKGSHKMGRVEHGRTGDQTGADMELVNAALDRMELVYCEMAPGDALFFHSNLLHRSDQNRSPDPRWVLICCYNARANDPYKDSGHPRYHYLEKWPDSRLKEIGRAQAADLAGRR
jgi:ectoine hydroxylase-related dioxygenase (phytanoyl-CoA dioxygenase family)